MEKFNPNMSEEEIAATAERMSKLASEFARKLKREMIEYAEAYLPLEYQVAFMINASLDMAASTLTATANALDKRNMKAEAEMALDYFGAILMPEIMRLAKGLGRAVEIGGEETKH